jgi:hypothetical protein
MWFFHEDYILDLFYIPCAGAIASERSNLKLVSRILVSSNTQLVIAIFALIVALILYIVIALAVSLTLVCTNLFPEENWTSSLLGYLLFTITYPLLLIAASFIVPLCLKYIPLFIVRTSFAFYSCESCRLLFLQGRLVLKLGGHRVKTGVRVVVDGYQDCYEKHRKSGLHASAVAYAFTQPLSTSG